MTQRKAAYDYRGKHYIVTAVGNVYLVQEFYACKDSPSGYYTAGEAQYVERGIEAVSPEQAIVIAVAHKP